MNRRHVLVIAILGILAISGIGTLVRPVASSGQAKSYPLYSVEQTAAGDVRNVVGTCTVNATLTAEAGGPVAVCTLNPGAREGAIFKFNDTNGDPTTESTQNSACPGGSGWYNVVITYPQSYTSNVVSVVYGGYFDTSDTGHLENPTNSGTVSGITLTNFHYRTELSTGGCWGLSWTSIGT